MEKSTAGPIRLLIADDHNVVRAGLCALLRQELDFEVVAEASNGVDAFDLWQIHKPDLALLDLGMPVSSGIDATRKIRAIDANARVIILSTYDGDEDVHSALRAGARGYLMKDAEPDELIGAIHKVMSGKTYVQAEIAQKLAARTHLESLTEREIGILRLVALGHPNKAVAVELGISEGTVKTHLKRILGKLNASTRTEAAAVAQKRGLIRL